MRRRNPPTLQTVQRVDGSTYQTLNTRRLKNASPLQTVIPAQRRLGLVSLILIALIVALLALALVVGSTHAQTIGEPWCQIGSAPAPAPLPALGEGLGACHPLGVVGAGSASTSHQRRPDIPADLRAEWLAAHDALAKHQPVPAELGLYDVDSDDSVRRKIDSLNNLIRFAEAAAANTLLDQLVMALADAKAAGVDVPPEFYETNGVSISVLEMRIGTVKNLIATRQGAQAMTAPATQQQQIETVAGQQIIARLQDMAAKSAQRTMSQSMSFDTVSALEHIAGSEAMRHSFCQRVFGVPKFADLKDPQRYAIFSWLKPARAAGSKAQPTNPKSSSEFAAVMATQSRPEPVEGEVTA